MTHKYLRNSLQVGNEPAVTHFCTGVLVEIQSITAAAFAPHSPPPWEELVASFHESVGDIHQRTQKLGTLLREDIISADFEPYAPSGYSRFEDESMMVCGTDSKPEAGEEVYCTIRLGLKSVTKHGRERGAGIQQSIVEKAEVVTERCVREAFAMSS